MLALLLACLPVDFDDTAAADLEFEARLTGLDPDAFWVSKGRGYSTGLGFIDIDGDGDAELLVADGNDMAAGPLRLHENRDGTLSANATWRSEAERYHAHLSIGDLNGDGRDDVAVSRYIGDAGFGDPGGVDLYLSDGSALLRSWSDDGFYTFSCDLGDVDRDGDLDLAVAVGESYYGDPDLSRVYTNDGTGHLTLAWTTEAPRHSYDVSWVDLDADGWLDLVFANDGDPHTAYFSDGAGGLQDEPGWSADGDGFEGNTLDWGDLDGDGWLDVVISDNLQQGGAGVVRAWCGPSLALCWQSADAADMQSAVSLEDIDGDGDLDLAAGSWWGAVRIYENYGGLEQTPSWASSPDDAVIEALAWEDVDGSEATVITVTGSGLVALPGRARSVSGGVASARWLSGPGNLSAEVVVSSARDLAVSDWDPASGERLYGRATSSAARSARTRSGSTGRRQLPSSLR